MATPKETAPFGSQAAFDSIGGEVGASTPPQTTPVTRVARTAEDGVVESLKLEEEDNNDDGPAEDLLVPYRVLESGLSILEEDVDYCPEQDVDYHYINPYVGVYAMRKVQNAHGIFVSQVDHLLSLHTRFGKDTSHLKNMMQELEAKYVLLKQLEVSYENIGNVLAAAELKLHTRTRSEGATADRTSERNGGICSQRTEYPHQTRGCGL